jgi:hypothetical protein
VLKLAPANWQGTAQGQEVQQALEAKSFGE